MRWGNVKMVTGAITISIAIFRLSQGIAREGAMNKYYHENCAGEVTGVNSATETPTCTKCGQRGEVWIKSRLDGSLFVFFRSAKEIKQFHEVEQNLNDWHKRGLV